MEHSPYQNPEGRRGIRRCCSRPTRDDRVHPGHARKMAARMLALGNDVQYYENIEGGHALADNAQRAATPRPAFTFLRQRLFASPG